MCIDMPMMPGQLLNCRVSEFCRKSNRVVLIEDDRDHKIETNLIKIADSAELDPVRVRLAAFDLVSPVPRFAYSITRSR